MSDEHAPDTTATIAPAAIEQDPLPRIHRRLIDASAEIALVPPDKADFLHSVMCQVGLPRRRTEARTFERQSGFVSILLEAGKLYNGREWVEQPLPYGATPRLVMVHVSTEAIRTKNRTVEIGDSMRQFLTMLGMPTSGGVRGGYGALKRQIEALAACRLMLGMHDRGRVVTVDAKPIKRFEAWLTPTRDQRRMLSDSHEPQHDHHGHQQSLWPGVLELSQEFFDTLTTHAVPLDNRALAALRHSALALDIYTWLAHRLCRVKGLQGARLSWQNLKEQFGQEYRTSKDFKREFIHALRQVLAVYPQARVTEVDGGLILHASRPPLAATMAAMPRAIQGTK